MQAASHRAISCGSTASAWTLRSPRRPSRFAYTVFILYLSNYYLPTSEKIISAWTWPSSLSEPWFLARREEWQPSTDCLPGFFQNLWKKKFLWKNLWKILQLVLQESGQGDYTNEMKSQIAEFALVTPHSPIISRLARIRLRTKYDELIVVIEGEIRYVFFVSYGIANNFN